MGRAPGPRSKRKLWVALVVIAAVLALPPLVAAPFALKLYYIPSEAMTPTLEVNDHIVVNRFAYLFGAPGRGDVVVFTAPRQADPIRNTEHVFIKRVIAVPGDLVRIGAGHVMVGEEQYSHRELRSALSSLAMSERVYVKLDSGGILVNGHRVSKEKVAAILGGAASELIVVPGDVFINGKRISEPYIAEDSDSCYPGNPRMCVNTKWIVKRKDGSKWVRIPRGKLLLMGDNRNESNDSRYWGLLDSRRVMGRAFFIYSPAARQGRIR